MARKLKVYIAGRISGLSKDEYTTKFGNAAEIIRRAGFIPVNPVEFVPKELHGSWQDCMRRCVATLAYCDLVFVLPNWKESHGATIEKTLADDLKIPVLYDISFFNKAAA